MKPEEEGQARTTDRPTETPKLKCNVRKWIDGTDGRHKGFGRRVASLDWTVVEVDMRQKKLLPSRPSSAAFHDGDGVVYVTDGAESDDRPSVRRVQAVGRAAAEFALELETELPKRRLVRCPKDETAVASSATAGQAFSSMPRGALRLRYVKGHR